MRQVCIFVLTLTCFGGASTFLRSVTLLRKVENHLRHYAYEVNQKPVTLFPHALLVKTVSQFNGNLIILKLLSGQADGLCGVSTPEFNPI